MGLVVVPEMHRVQERGGEMLIWDVYRSTTVHTDHVVEVRPSETLPKEIFKVFLVNGQKFFTNADGRETMLRAGRSTT